jgi:hypothetical protein
MAGIKVETIERRSDGTLPAFTSLGSHPIAYYTATFDTLCAVCASKDDTSDPAVWADVHYEGPPEECCDCGAEIESAYGDPDAS